MGAWYSSAYAQHQHRVQTGSHRRAQTHASATQEPGRGPGYRHPGREHLGTHDGPATSAQNYMVHLPLKTKDCLGYQFRCGLGVPASGRPDGPGTSPGQVHYLPAGETAGPATGHASHQALPRLELGAGKLLPMYDPEARTVQIRHQSWGLVQHWAAMRGDAQNVLGETFSGLLAPQTSIFQPVRNILGLAHGEGQGQQMRLRIEAAALFQVQSSVKQ